MSENNWSKSSPLFEEFIEDTRILTRSLIQWGDRWITISEQLGEVSSDAQREILQEVMDDFEKACEDLGAETDD